MISRRGFLRGLAGVAAGTAVTKIVGPFSALSDRPKLFVNPKPLLDTTITVAMIRRARATLQRYEPNEVGDQRLGYFEDWRAAYGGQFAVIPFRMPYDAEREVHWRNTSPIKSLTLIPVP